MNASDFWSNQDSAQKVIKEMKAERARIEPFLEVEKALEDVDTMYQLGAEAKDAAAIDEADHMMYKVEKAYGKVELQALFTGAHDYSDCYVQIHSGAGGTEACDWTSMLFRMYLKFWEKKGWDVSELERTDGEQAGIRSINLMVKGEWATGIMNCEVGVHRLVRISPFDANARRHILITKDAVHILHRLFQALAVIQIALGQFHPLARQLPRGFAVRAAN